MFSSEYVLYKFKALQFGAGEEDKVDRNCNKLTLKTVDEILLRW